MRVGLVAPLDSGCGTNPGAHMITAGIRYLVGQAVPEVVFVPVEMLHDDRDSWLAAATCQALIICGNPRFSMSEPSWHECGLLKRLAELQSTGIKVIDGWSGATHGYVAGATVHDMAAALLEFPRTAEYMKLARRFSGRITRDPLMTLLYERSGTTATQLPCSSYWAPQHYRSRRAGLKAGSVVAVLGQLGRDDMSAAVAAVIEQLSGPVRVIASMADDLRHMHDAGIEAELVFEPEALLEVYAKAQRVIAFRLHAAIPAAAMGCEVGLVAVDSRALAAEPFGIPVIGIDEIGTRPIEFGYATLPDQGKAVETLRGMLC